MHPATATALFLLLSSCICAAQPALRYRPSIWNQTCKYKAFDVPIYQFFAGVDDFGDPVFPLDLGNVQMQYQYPLEACFGPSEKYNDTLVSQGKKLPCAYSFNRKYNVDYWEEQPCPTTLRANCYCYAINRYKGGFCIPGLGSNPMQDPINEWDCTTLDKLLVADGARRVSWAVALKNRPNGTHYMAAAVSPPASPQGSDYHLWRLDANGAWSWKSGYLFVRNTYSNNTLVRDVRDKSIRLLYPHLCGVYDVDAHTHKLGAISSSVSDIPPRFQSWKDRKYGVDIEKLQVWSKGWYGLYKNTYVRATQGDLPYQKLAALNNNADPSFLPFPPGKEPWRSSLSGTPAMKAASAAAAILGNKEEVSLAKTKRSRPLAGCKNKKC